MNDSETAIYHHHHLIMNNNMTDGEEYDKRDQSYIEQMPLGLKLDIPDLIESWERIQLENTLHSCPQHQHHQHQQQQQCGQGLRHRHLMYQQMHPIKRENLFNSDKSSLFQKQEQH